jgi:hypothetical protein
MEISTFYVLLTSVANVAVNKRVNYEPHMNQPSFTNHFLVTMLSVVGSCFSFSISYTFASMTLVGREG